MSGTDMDLESELRSRGDIQTRLAYLMPIARTFYPSCIADVLRDAYSEIGRLQDSVQELEELTEKKTPK